MQARGHLLAMNGIVTLTVDATGSGERSEREREWSYHGGMKAAELFLAGDSLMGVQIRDNRKALDVLQSLPFVNGERLGATGPSGGGNQTMWLSALDDRVKVAVPVVSIGLFEVYVTESNCMCETLPGGLRIAEEWKLLGLMAPRPLLIMNALNDARDRFDFRLIDMTHGYHAAPLQAMLGWMRHRLLDAPGSMPVVLPDWTPVVEEELLCYSIGERPDAVGYKSVRETIRLSQPFDKDLELAELVGWNAPAEVCDFVVKKQLPDGTQVGAIQSSRDLPLPVVLSGEWDSAGEEIRLILSPSGKKSDFVRAEWPAAATAGIFAMTADFPGVGELAWETDEGGGARLHDTARACLWLGYSLGGEWAEAIASICFTIRARAPRSNSRAGRTGGHFCRALGPGASPRSGFRTYRSERFRDFDRSSKWLPRMVRSECFAMEGLGFTSIFECLPSVAEAPIENPNFYLHPLPNRVKSHRCENWGDFLV